MSDRMIKVADAFLEDARSACNAAAAESNCYIAEEKFLAALPYLDKAESALGQADLGDDPAGRAALGMIALERADVYQAAGEAVSTYGFKGEDGREEEQRALSHLAKMLKFSRLATELKPNDPLVWYKFGLRTVLRDVLEAGKAFEISARLDPDGEIGTAAAKELFEIQGELDAARRTQQARIAEKRRQEEERLAAEKREAERQQHRSAAHDEYTSMCSSGDAAAITLLIRGRQSEGACPLCNEAFKPNVIDRILRRLTCKECRAEGKKLAKPA